MSTMPLSEMRDALRWDLENNGTLTPAQLNRWINWSYLHISQPNIHPHQSLQATGTVPLVLDQVEYPLTGLGFVLWGVYSCTYIKGTTVAPTNYRRRLKGGGDIRWLDAQFASSGEPSSYAVWGGAAGGQTLHINARPSSGVVGNLLLIRGYKQPTLLAADTDKTVMHDLWDEAILLGARWRGWRSLTRPERAEIARVEFGLQVNEIQNALKLDASDWGGRFEIDMQPYMQEQ